MLANPLQTRPREARDKALAINLDPRRYGTFAEIGAGQEVVRWFFRAGGAAGTIAKSVSAYDMAVSDAHYGPCERYVCRRRLQSMLDAEYDGVVRQLDPARGGTTAFFAFADTVSARNFKGTNECHGWAWNFTPIHPWHSFVPLKLRADTVSANAKNAAASPRVASSWRTVPSNSASSMLCNRCRQTYRSHGP